MAEHTYSLSYYLKEAKGKLKAKVYLRIIYNRKKAEAYTGFMVSPDKWNFDYGISENKAIRKELDLLSAKVDESFRKLKESETPLSAKAIRDLTFDKLVLKTTFKEFFENEVKALAVRQNFSDGTKRNFRATQNHLFNFLASKNLEHIELKHINYSLIKELDVYLMKQKTPKETTLSRNHVNKQHQRINQVLQEAFREGKLKTNPYEKFNLHFEKVEKEFLEQHELEAIEKVDLKGNLSLEKVRDIFLFSCYTGLRYSDALNLQTKNLMTVNGELYIYTSQQKTEGRLRAPLFKQAIQIIKKYDNEERKITGFILPRMSNAKVNVYLKTIADLANIQKNVTHHTARHTFATTFLLNRGMRKDIVKEFLGHKDMKATEIYAKMVENTLKEAKDKIEGND